MKKKIFTIVFSMVIGVGLYKFGEYVLTMNMHNSGMLVTDMPSGANCSCNYSTDKAVTTISATTASLMSQLYYQNRKSGRVGLDEANPDSRSVWFSLERLKNFMWKIESAACRDTCLQHRELGIRIYFGEYPDANTLAGIKDLKSVNPSYAFRHTVFMVPTFSYNNTDFDFNPWTLRNGCVVDLARTNQKTMVFSLDAAVGTGIFSPAPSDIDAMNHASMIPPGPSKGAVFIE